MPTKSYKWIAVDFASAKVIDRLLKTSGIGNREFDRLSDSAINYGRVRDIRNGLKAPVRLSEFLIICHVCHADPVVTLREIIAEAQRIETRQNTSAEHTPSVTPSRAELEATTTREQVSEVPDEQVVDSALTRIMSLAAKHGDTTAEQEAYEEQP